MRLPHFAAKLPEEEGEVTEVQTKKKRDKEAEPTFEDSISRLTEIVDQLEDGELPLEQSLSLFEEGMKLVSRSQATLAAAEKRVEELISVDEQGNPLVREHADLAE